MGFFRFLARRILILPPVLVGVTLISFSLANFVPGDPLAAVLGIRGLNNPETVARYKEKWGLDRSLPERYLIYLNNLLHGDFGYSFTTQRPVWEDIREFLPATLELTLAAILIAISGGLVFGIMAAVSHNRWPDHLVRLLALLGSSLPVFWLGLIALQVFYVRLKVLPGPVGRLDPAMTPPPTVTGMYTVDALLHGDLETFWDAVRHMILPATVLGYFVMGLIARITRSSLLEVFSVLYIRTARGKGLSERVILLRHALPNALIPTITVVGLAFAGLLAGAVLTETIFSWPGIGRYAVQAAQGLDFQAILGVTIVIAIMYSMVNLVVDVVYALVDPRIRLD
jgi:peptide/nickel transport system permease protein